MVGRLAAGPCPGHHTPDHTGSRLGTCGCGAPSKENRHNSGGRKRREEQDKKTRGKDGARGGGRRLFILAAYIWHEIESSRFFLAVFLYLNCIDMEGHACGHVSARL